MYDKRARNAEIFRNTEYMYKTNTVLKKAVYDSIQGQKLILENSVVVYEVRNESEGKVVVSGKRTIEASEPYAKQGKHVCVLNFASATNPGGGVIHGASAQEAAICRCSTLYPCLNTKVMWEAFYMPHRALENPLYNNDCIITPQVKVFKSDIDFPEELQEAEWWNVDVITCAAPNLRNNPSNMMNPGAGSQKADVPYEELRELLMRRIQRIFEVAIGNGAEVLILGAFGCGAFRNPPKLVAEVFAEFTEKYRKCFDTIEYAIFHTKKEMENYEAFKEAMGKYLL